MNDFYGAPDAAFSSGNSATIKQIKQEDNQMQLSSHLTPAPIDGVARITHAGMASWAIPNSPYRCADCTFWDHSGRANKQMHLFGAPTPRRCRKYFALMNKAGAAVPHDARACKFFEPINKKVQP
jgi:hypothetical protein